MNDKSLDRQGIEEMTALLRAGDADFRGLREALELKGFDPQQLVLAYCIEGEDMDEIGVFITADRAIYEFERSNEGGQANVESFQYRQLTDTEAAIKDYPEISTALEVLEEQTAAPEYTP